MTSFVSIYDLTQPKWGETNPTPMTRMSILQRSRYSARTSTADYPVFKPQPACAPCFHSAFWKNKEICVKRMWILTTLCKWKSVFLPVFRHFKSCNEEAIGGIVQIQEFSMWEEKKSLFLWKTLETESQISILKIPKDGLRNYMP